MNKTGKILLIALFLLAMSGLMLHYRIHNFVMPDKVNPQILHFSATRFLAFIFPLIDVVIVTLLFCSRRTCVYGFLLNGLIVIYGTIFMAHFSIAELTAKSAPLSDWFIKSTLPDIGITWADFLVGKAIYDIYMKT